MLISITLYAPFSLVCDSVSFWICCRILGGISVGFLFCEIWMIGLFCLDVELLNVEEAYVGSLVVDFFDIEYFLLKWISYAPWGVKDDC